MLKVNVRGENIEVTSAIRDYIEKKVSKLEKYLDQNINATAHVNLKTYPDKTAKVEVTIPLPYLVLRAEETSTDMYGSIDLVTDKLIRQIRKHKTKVNRKSREKGFDHADFVNDVEGEADEKKVATVTKDQVKEIAETKMQDLNAADVEAAMRMIEGTARSMGFVVED